MAVNNWLVVEGAKICLTEMNPATAEFLMSSFDGSIRTEISEWNRYAVARKGNYDSETIRLKWRAPDSMADFIAPYLRDGQEVLDVGCGSGLVKSAFLEKGKPRNLVFDGIDFSREMLKKAKRVGYRNLFCADVSRKDLSKAVWSDIGFVKKYPVVVSVGAYGDFVYKAAIPFALELADEKSVIGIAGRESELGGVEGLLKNVGFSLLRQESCVAHIVYPLKKDDPRYAFERFLSPKMASDGKVQKIRYTYFIAKR